VRVRRFIEVRAYSQASRRPLWQRRKAQRACHTLSHLVVTPCHTLLSHLVVTPCCHTLLSHLVVTPCLIVVAPFVGPLPVVGRLVGQTSLLLRRLLLRRLSLLPLPLSFCLLASVAVSPLLVFFVCVCVCVCRCVCGMSVCGMLSPNLSLLVLRVCILMCVGACACVSVSACVCLCLPLCKFVWSVVC